MSNGLDLIDETKSHFNEGARSVRAYTDDETLIITKADDNGFWIAKEESGFPKTKAGDLTDIFQNVFGIEARY